MPQCPYDSPAEVLAVFATWQGTPDQKAQRWWGTPEFDGVPPPPLGFTSDQQAAAWIASNYTCPT